MRRFEQEMLDHLRRNTDVLSTIEETGQLSDETEAALDAAVSEFAAGFVAGEGGDLTTDTTLADGEEADVSQEQIVTQKRG